MLITSNSYSNKITFAITIVITIIKNRIVDSFHPIEYYHRSQYSTQTNKSSLIKHVKYHNNPCKSQHLIQETSRNIIYSCLKNRMNGGLINTNTLLSSMNADGDNIKEEETPESPSYSTIIRFICTTIFLWLSEPLLSLVDTTIMSHSKVSEISQLAALGVGTTIMDCSIYLTHFLAITTTNMLAKAIASNDMKEQSNITSNALGISMILGLLISFIVFGFGKYILIWMVTGGEYLFPSSAKKVITDEAWYVIHQAASYCKIRALAAPFSVMGSIAQCIVLVHLDIKTAIIAVIVTTAINIIGDTVLCIYPYSFGVQGAAMATSLATSIGTYILISSIRKRLSKQNTTSLPKTKKSWYTFLSIAGSTSFVIIGELIMYTLMSIRIARFGSNDSSILSLACHNILLRCFFFFSSFGDSISQAIQTFLPKTTTTTIINNNDSIMHSSSTSKYTSQKNKSKMQQNTQKSPIISLLSKFTILSSFTSIFAGSISYIILKYKSNLFINSSATSPISANDILSNNAKYLALSLIAYPFNALSEGILLSTNNLSYLIKVYIITLSVAVTHMFRFSSTLSDVWMSLTFFEYARLAFFVWKVYLFLALQGTKRDDGLIVT